MEQITVRLIYDRTTVPINLRKVIATPGEPFAKTLGEFIKIDTTNSKSLPSQNGNLPPFSSR